MKLLHLDASIKTRDSVSRELTAAIVGRIKKEDGSVEVIYRDLVATPPPHMTLVSLPKAHPTSAMAGELSTADQEIREGSNLLLQEFLEADTIVIGVPVYNFTIPTQLKAWLDVIIVPGLTFAYANPPQGLMGHKRVILAVTRGAVYTPETAHIFSEYAEPYLRFIFSFLGMTPEFVIAEGLTLGEQQRSTAIASAMLAVREISL